ncbi:hypothetical protein BD410DRAFT_139608 [Rickenella mellea]|uniref:Uncharacterized protein n=1 Tax=Rickenella mellea TaxID=50990 RepID=A0A4Y7PII2_9AGAM|nr:hypothetical protein BD410DRAFT_139608 [Rickenella mellea]
MPVNYWSECHCVKWLASGTHYSPTSIARRKRRIRKTDRAHGRWWEDSTEDLSWSSPPPVFMGWLIVSFGMFVPV